MSAINSLIIKHLLRHRLSNIYYLFPRKVNQFIRCASGYIREDHGIFPIRRSLLYVPASESAKLAKIASLTSPDCLVLDCEDGVSVDCKQTARDNIRALYNTASAFPTQLLHRLAVRVNSVCSGQLNEDLSTILAAKHHPHTFLLPKVNDVQDVRYFYQLYSTVCCHGNTHPPRALLIYCESAHALLNWYQVCSQSAHYLAGVSRDTRAPALRLEGIILGADDLCADMGTVRTEEALELLYARQHVVTVARALGLQAIDMVCTNFRGHAATALLQRECEQGARFGFSGKQAIHPNQVETVQTAYSPSAEKVRWATEVLRLHAEQQASGKGVLVYEGRALDMPLILQARNVLSVHNMLFDRQ